MFDVVLYEPEIPPNTGNIIRLAANTGCRLHLVGPLGFGLGERRLRRAGLDYRDLAQITRHRDWDSCRLHFAARRMFALSTQASRSYADAGFAPGDVFVFGPETRGLPAEVLAAFAPEMRLSLPMRAASRSLNLANAVAVVIYEAWRQQRFAGAAVPAQN